MTSLRLPKWLFHGVVTTIVTAALTGIVAWAAGIGPRFDKHETRISVIEEHQRGIDKSLAEIKASQLDQAKDVKEILRRLPRH